jgi:prepilin-type N-terminal cleavage/methylation domain-containing protein
MHVHPTNRQARAGFSLIEVNMALLVVGIGLAALLGLFPAALRESSLASADTSQSLFADQILNMLHANASSITNWPDWTNANYDKLLDGLAPGPEDDVRVPTVSGTVAIECGNHHISDYLTPDTHIEYDLLLEGAGGDVIRARLYVGDRKTSNIYRNPIYTTEFIFMGM